MKNSSKIYFPDLDALRAFAALAVVFSHFPKWLNFSQSLQYLKLTDLFKLGGHGGSLGVVFFFILSGFLITYLLFQEQERKGRVQILNFYMRRILRIWPLYFFSLLIGFVIYPNFLFWSGEQLNETSNVWMYVFFAANFDHIYGVFPAVGILGVQWSVCVEEQFYLLWPLMLILFKRKMGFPVFCIGLIIFSEWFYVFEMFEKPGGLYHLFSCFRFLALGGLIAWISFFKLPQLEKIFTKFNVFITVMIYCIGFSSIVFQTKIELMFESYRLIADVLPAAFFAFIILEQNYSSSSLIKFRNLKWATYLGKISYGIYLLHMVAIYLANALLPLHSEWISVKIILSLLLTVLLADISFRYMESYFLKWKKRFEV